MRGPLVTGAVAHHLGGRHFDVAKSAVGKNFLQYIDDLDSAGYIAPSLKPSVDKIRVRGNAANHDLPASTEADSLVTLKLTEFLLRGIYEIPGL